MSDATSHDRIDQLHAAKKCACYGYPVTTQDCYLMLPEDPASWVIDAMFVLPLGQRRPWVPDKESED